MMNTHKDMIISSVDANGAITISATHYDPTSSEPIAIFANTGFYGWILKIKDNKTIINNSAPTSILNRVYNLITW
jgi:hypothetical protein